MKTTQKQSKLFKAIQKFNIDNKLNIEATQTENGVIVKNKDYRFLSFLQRNRNLHNGMNGAGLVFNAQ